MLDLRGAPFGSYTLLLALLFPQLEIRETEQCKKDEASFYTQTCASAPIDGSCYKRREPCIFLVSLLESCRDNENQENFPVMKTFQ